VAIEQQPQSHSTLFETSLRLYRRTIKRFRPAHSAVHWLLSHTFIPAMEKIRNFQTMPDDPFWFRLELLTNRHEPETTAQLRSLIKPGMTVLDIGAHVGYYSRMASELVGENGRVVAFEPHPRNHATLLRNIGSRKNVTPLQVALAESEGTAELHDYLMMSASGSLHYDESIRDVQLSHVSEDDIAPRIGADFQPQIYTVRTAPVDDLLAEIGVQSVDVVKMDIEGAEMGALRGMKQTIANSPKLALVMEYNPLGLQAFGNQPVESLKEVLALGFSSVAIIQPDGSLTDITASSDAIEKLTERLVQNMGVVNLLLTR